MSQKKDSTGVQRGARAEEGCKVVRLRGCKFAATSEATLLMLGGDYERKENVWREVPEHFARYIEERDGMPIEGPAKSGSFADNTMQGYSATAGAVHCVIAVVEKQYYARFVGLVRWAEALAELRACISHKGTKGTKGRD